jgi:hypothetical protein
MDHFVEKGGDKLDEKAKKSLNYFSDRMRKEIDEIQVPEEEITHENLSSLLKSIQKLFVNINDIAKKTLPRFKKIVQAEIKELEYITRKLGNKNKALDQFLRKKYTELKDAEYQLKKLPKFFTLRENIEHAKKDLDILQSELEEKQKYKEELIDSLKKIEKDPLFAELEEKERVLSKLRMNVNNQMGFKKALKKFKFELEKNKLHVSNVDENFLRDFLKNPINSLVNERKDLPKFSSLLIQLRHVLEENKLNLKTETREKTISHINSIFEEKLIESEIEKIKTIQANLDEIERKIKEAGLANKREEIKNLISINTVKIEHLESDVERKNKDYMRYLSTLKTERESFQNEIEDILNEEIKLTITFDF